MALTMGQRLKCLLNFIHFKFINVHLWTPYIQFLNAIFIFKWLKIWSFPVYLSKLIEGIYIKYTISPCASPHFIPCTDSYIIFRWKAIIQNLTSIWHEWCEVGWTLSLQYVVHQKCLFYFEWVLSQISARTLIAALALIGKGHIQKIFHRYCVE